MDLTQFSRSKSAFLALKEEGVNLVKSPEDIGIVLGKGRIGSPNDEIKKELEDFLKTYIATMVGIVKPSSEQLVALTSYANTVDGKMSIKKAGRDQVKTLEDFAYLLDPYEESPSEGYLKAIEDFKKANPFKDAEGNVVEVKYVTCTYLLKTRVIKMKKGQYLGAAYDNGLACKKALKKCEKGKKRNWRCHQEE